MKKILLLATILYAFTGLQAQQVDRSKEILDQVTAKTKAYKTISAEFLFTQDNDEMDIHENIDGSIKIKGEKYVVALPDFGVHVYSDGSTIWNYMKEGNQVTISNIDDAGSDLMDPANLFNIYEKGFQSKFVEEKTENGTTVYVIDLLPETDEHDVEEIRITINKSTMMLQSASLLSTDGNTYGINVKKLETDTELAETDLAFKSENYPDLEIIDLR